MLSLNQCYSFFVWIRDLYVVFLDNVSKLGRWSVRWILMFFFNTLLCRYKTVNVGNVPTTSL